MRENNYYFPTNLAAGLSFINPTEREGEQHLHPQLKPIDIPLPSPPPSHLFPLISTALPCLPLDGRPGRRFFKVERMAVEWSDGGEEFLLPDEFLDDDFFSEEEKAAVAARSESDEEDSLAGLSRRLAGLLGGDKLAVTPAKEEVTAGSPKSTLCGLPKSGQESPNSGASQGNSPPSSPLEQQPPDPWDVLYEAAGQVNSIPAPGNPYGLHGRGGFLPPARKASPPPPPPHVPAPAGTAAGGVYYHPFAHLITQRQIQAARVSSQSHGALVCVSYLKISSSLTSVFVSVLCSFISSNSSSSSSSRGTGSWPRPLHGACVVTRQPRGPAPLRLT
ncbi:hypothetical protein VPH35_003418 [Triticum aestivum]